MTRMSKLLALGGDRGGRAKTSSSGLESARQERSPRRGGFTGATRVAGQPAARPAGRRETDGTRGFGNGAAALSAEPAPPRGGSGMSSAEVGARDRASRVGDTADASSLFSTLVVGKHADRAAGARETREARRCLGPHRNQEPFMRLGGGGLGSRVRPGVAQATAGRRRWTRLRSAGEARRATRHQRDVGRDAFGDDNAPERSIGSPKWARGVNRGLPHHVGTCGAACAETWGDHL